MTKTSTARRAESSPGRERGRATFLCPDCDYHGKAVPTRVLRTRRIAPLIITRERRCPECDWRAQTWEQLTCKS